MPGLTLMRYVAPQPGQLTVSTAEAEVLWGVSPAGMGRFGGAGTTTERDGAERGCADVSGWSAAG